MRFTGSGTQGGGLVRSPGRTPQRALLVLTVLQPIAKAATPSTNLGSSVCRPTPHSVPKQPSSAAWLTPGCIQHGFSFSSSETTLGCLQHAENSGYLEVSGSETYGVQSPRERFRLVRSRPRSRRHTGESAQSQTHTRTRAPSHKHSARPSRSVSSEGDGPGRSPPAGAARCCAALPGGAIGIELSRKGTPTRCVMLRPWRPWSHVSYCNFQSPISHLPRVFPLLRPKSTCVF